MKLCWIIFLLASSCQPFKYKKNNKLHWKGAVVAHVHERGKGYGSGVSKKLYSHLEKMGYNSIQLNTFAYQRGLGETRLQWNDPTLTPDDLAGEIRLAHSYGMQVMLKPHIWVSDAGSPGAWRSGIHYTDPKKLALWFQEYQRFLNANIRVAIQNNVEIFVVGTELVKLSRETKYWKEIIRNIRAQGYRGKLTYACEAWNARNIDFWGELDLIGLDFYYGLKEENPSVKRLSEFYAEKILSHLKHARKYSLPVVFTELGFPSHQYAIQRPALWRKANLKPRDDLQTKAYRAMRLAMKNTTHPRGIWFWKYVTTLDSYERKNQKTGFILEQKPAEQEIKKINH